MDFNSLICFTGQGNCLSLSGDPYRVLIGPTQNRRAYTSCASSHTFGVQTALLNPGYFLLFDYDLGLLLTYLSFYLNPGKLELLLKLNGAFSCILVNSPRCL
jgi:hypothetical protein